MRRLFLLLFMLPTFAFAVGQDVPRGWSRIGALQGMLGNDWYTRKTIDTVSFARQADLQYVAPVVDGLEASYQANRAFLGLTPPQPLEFYFCPMDQPGHQQPRFAARLGHSTRFAGIALGGTNICLINLGDARHSTPYPTWEVAQTCRHEMNHLFAFQLKGSDRKSSWGWLYEALAHTAENTIKPPGSQINLASMKTYMKGYKSADANWVNLINDRNNDEQEQFRDYDKLLVSIIFFLQDKYGNQSIAKLMANCRGRDLEDALAATYGTGAAGLEVAWKSYYGIR